MTAKFLIAIGVLVHAADPLTAQSAAAERVSLSAALPQDPKVTVGTLANGLRYYIRRNAKPERRAELRLVVNAGSILETNQQRGYAHFVEHTAFNGTTHFARNELVEYLQAIGVRFGADLNAYTGFDETVYILPIPTDTPKIVDQAFTILADWAHGQVFDSAEVIAERGVVHEEWRGGRGAGQRMLTQYLPIILKNSRYAERLPIGTESSILSATAPRLRAFYRDWYRPELMAVVAVGDFDPTIVEQKIREHFGRISRRAGAPRRLSATIPSNRAPLIAIASDREAVGTSVTLYFKLPGAQTTTVADYRRDLTAALYLQMLNGRLSELTQRPGAPFLSAYATKGDFVGRDLEPFSLSAAVGDSGVERALAALLVEARRVDHFGFLASELDRARTNLLRSYERANAERDKTESGAYAAEYVRAYLDGEAIPGIEYEYARVQELLPTISLTDVNGLASAWISDTNRVVLVQAPRKDDTPLPTEATINAALLRASGAAVTPYTESVSTDALLPSLGAPGRIVTSRTLPAGVTEWTLSNGARVILKPTDFKEDEILFAATSPGGSALVSDQDFMSAAYAPQIVALSGLGTFNLIDLRKKLAGRVARVTPAIGEMSEGLAGAASPKDLELLLQLTYLHFTGARIDTTAFTAFRSNVAPFVANRSAAPEQVFSDTIQVTLARGSVRARPLTPETFSEIDPQRALAIFRERFGDAGDFVFALVGSVDTVTLKPLVERYLASLPSTGRVDAPRPAIPPPPRGIVLKTVHKGVEPKATTLFFFTGPCTYAPQTRFDIRALMEVFQMRLTESLRERLGGTYSPGAGGGCGREPREEYALQVQFESAPDNVESLSAAVLSLMDSLKTHGPTAADIQRAREQILRGREVEVTQNGYWLSNMLARYRAGEDIGGLLEPYDEMVRALTAGQVQAAARRYFDTSNYLRFVLLPAAP